jgi:hypothetical protein
LLDPKSEELKKALEVVSPELKFQFGDLDSRSLVDNFLVKLFFEQQTDNTITKVLGGDVASFKAAVADFLKDVDGQPQDLLSHAVIDPCIVKNEAEALLAISQIILFEHSNAEAAAFFAKKAYDLAPQNYRVLLNYASTILRQKYILQLFNNLFYSEPTCLLVIKHLSLSKRPLNSTLTMFY